MAARVGIYPGTFDPVHAGHVAFALAARQECNLDKVVFLPEAQPRGKRDVTDISHRVALLRSAVASTPELGMTQLSQPTFTVHGSLPELHALFKDDELTLLVGSDVARSLMSWPDVDALLENMRIAVGVRTGGLEKAAAVQLASSAHAVMFVHTEFAGLASTEVRSGKASHVTAAAAEYAQKHALYCRTERSYAS